MHGQFGTIPIIDTHQHLWDLRKIALAWLKDPLYRKLDRDHLSADYAEAASGLNIVKTIYMEVDARPADQRAEADYVLDLCQNPGSGMVGAVLGGRPGDDSFMSWIDGFRGNASVKGFREVLFDKPAGYAMRETFVRGVRHLGDAGFSFDVEAPADLLPEVMQLVDSCPNTLFILDHCAHPDLCTGDIADWKQQISRFAERDNVVLKISGAFSAPGPPLPRKDALASAVNHVLETFGPERVVFGSDWPVVTMTSSLQAWVEAIVEIMLDHDPADIQKLFHDNAVRIYRLG